MSKLHRYPINLLSLKLHAWAILASFSFLVGCSPTHEYVFPEITSASYQESTGIQAISDTGLVLFSGANKNLIANGSFDQWGKDDVPMGWISLRGVGISKTFDNGEIVARISGKPGDDRRRFVYKHAIPLQEAESIRVSADIKSPNIQAKDFCFFHIQLKDHNGELITPTSNGSQISTGWGYSAHLEGWYFAIRDGRPETGWKNITAPVFTAPIGSNAQAIQVAFHPSSSTQFLIDNVVIQNVFSQVGVITSRAVALPPAGVSLGALHAKIGLIQLGQDAASHTALQVVTPAFDGQSKNNTVYCITNNDTTQNLGDPFVYRYSKGPTTGDPSSGAWQTGQLTNGDLSQIAYNIGGGYQKVYVEFDFRDILWVEKFETYATFLNASYYVEAMAVLTSQDGAHFTLFGHGQAPKRSQLGRNQDYTIAVSGRPVRARYVRLVWHKPAWSLAFWITEAKVWGQPDPTTRVAFRTRTAASPEGFLLAPWSCSQWSQPFRAGESIPSPPNRYLQYQVALKRISPTVSPMVSNIQVGVGY